LLTRPPSTVSLLRNSAYDIADDDDDDDDDDCDDDNEDW
jgi:hypothetical protein